MIRTCMALILGAVDLALGRLAWLSIEQHRILGLPVLLLAAAAVLCHVVLFWR